MRSRWLRVAALLLLALGAVSALATVSGLHLEVGKSGRPSFARRDAAEIPAATLVERDDAVVFDRSHAEMQQKKFAEADKRADGLRQAEEEADGEGEWVQAEDEAPVLPPRPVAGERRTMADGDQWADSPAPSQTDAEVEADDNAAPFAEEAGDAGKSWPVMRELLSLLQTGGLSEYAGRSSAPVSVLDSEEDEGDAALQSLLRSIGEDSLDSESRKKPSRDPAELPDKDSIAQGAAGSFDYGIRGAVPVSQLKQAYAADAVSKGQWELLQQVLLSPDEAVTACNPPTPAPVPSPVPDTKLTGTGGSAAGYPPAPAAPQPAAGAQAAAAAPSAAPQLPKGLTREVVIALAEQAYRARIALLTEEITRAVGIAPRKGSGDADKPAAGALAVRGTSDNSGSSSKTQQTQYVVPPHTLPPRPYLVHDGRLPPVEQPVVVLGAGAGFLPLRLAAGLPRSTVLSVTWPSGGAAAATASGATKPISTAASGSSPEVLTAAAIHAVLKAELGLDNSWITEISAEPADGPLAAVGRYLRSKLAHDPEEGTCTEDVGSISGRSSDGGASDTEVASLRCVSYRHVQAIRAALSQSAGTSSGSSVAEHVGGRFHPGLTVLADLGRLPGKALPFEFARALGHILTVSRYSVVVGPLPDTRFFSYWPSLEALVKEAVESVGMVPTLRVLGRSSTPASAAGSWGATSTGDKSQLVLLAVQTPAEAEYEAKLYKRAAGLIEAAGVGKPGKAGISSLPSLASFATVDTSLVPGVAVRYCADPQADRPYGGILPPAAAASSAVPLEILLSLGLLRSDALEVGRHLLTLDAPTSTVLSSDASSIVVYGGDVYIAANSPVPGAMKSTAADVSRTGQSAGSPTRMEGGSVQSAPGTAEEKAAGKWPSAKAIADQVAAAENAVLSKRASAAGAVAGNQAEQTQKRTAGSARTGGGQGAPAGTRDSFFAKKQTTQTTVVKQDTKAPAAPAKLKPAVKPAAVKQAAGASDGSSGAGSDTSVAAEAAELQKLLQQATQEDEASRNAAEEGVPQDQAPAATVGDEDQLAIAEEEAEEDAESLAAAQAAAVAQAEAALDTEEAEHVQDEQAGEEEPADMGEGLLLDEDQEEEAPSAVGVGGRRLLELAGGLFKRKDAAAGQNAAAAAAAQGNNADNSATGGSSVPPENAIPVLKDNSWANIRPIPRRRDKGTSADGRSPRLSSWVEDAGRAQAQLAATEADSFRSWWRVLAGEIASLGPAVTAVTSGSGLSLLAVKLARTLPDSLVLSLKQRDSEVSNHASLLRLLGIDNNLLASTQLTEARAQALAAAEDPVRLAIHSADVWTELLDVALQVTISTQLSATVGIAQEVERAWEERLGGLLRLAATTMVELPPFPRLAHAVAHLTPLCETACALQGSAFAELDADAAGRANGRSRSGGSGTGNALSAWSDADGDGFLEQPSQLFEGAGSDATLIDGAEAHAAGALDVQTASAAAAAALDALVADDLGYSPTEEQNGGAAAGNALRAPAAGGRSLLQLRGSSLFRRGDQGAAAAGAAAGGAAPAMPPADAPAITQRSSMFGLRGSAPASNGNTNTGFESGARAAADQVDGEASAAAAAAAAAAALAAVDPALAAVTGSAAKAASAASSFRKSILQPSAQLVRRMPLTSPLADGAAAALVARYSARTEKQQLGAFDRVYGPYRALLTSAADTVGLDSARVRLLVEPPRKQQAAGGSKASLRVFAAVDAFTVGAAAPQPADHPVLPGLSLHTLLTLGVARDTAARLVRMFLSLPLPSIMRTAGERGYAVGTGEPDGPRLSFAPWLLRLVRDQEPACGARLQFALTQPVSQSPTAFTTPLCLDASSDEDDGAGAPWDEEEGDDTHIRETWSALASQLTPIDTASGGGPDRFSFVEYGSGLGYTSLAIARAFPEATVLSIEGHSEATDAHLAAALRGGIGNNVIARRPVDADLFKKLHNSPEFFRYQMFSPDFSSMLLRYARDVSGLQSALGNMFALAATSFLRLPSAHLLSLAFTTFADTYPTLRWVPSRQPRSMYTGSVLSIAHSLSSSRQTLNSLHCGVRLRDAVLEAAGETSNAASGAGAGIFCTGMGRFAHFTSLTRTPLRNSAARYDVTQHPRPLLLGAEVRLLADALRAPSGTNIAVIAAPVPAPRSLPDSMDDILAATTPQSTVSLSAVAGLGLSAALDAVAAQDESANAALKAAAAASRWLHPVLSVTPGTNGASVDTGFSDVSRTWSTVSSGIVRVDILNLTRHVNHHFQSEIDGHSRKYTLRVQANYTAAVLLAASMRAGKGGANDDGPRTPLSLGDLTAEGVYALLPPGNHPNHGHTTAWLGADEAGVPGFSDHSSIAAAVIAASAADGHRQGEFSNLPPTQLAPATLLPGVTSIILTRDMDDALIPFTTVHGITLITGLRLGLLAPLRTRAYHQFVSLPLYQDMAPWNIVFLGPRLDYIDFDTRDHTYDAFVPKAYEVMEVLFNYKRTVEDFKKCGGKAGNPYNFPFVSDCVAAPTFTGPCKDSSKPVPCGDGTCRSDYISCLRAISEAERRDGLRNDLLWAFREYASARKEQGALVSGATEQRGEDGSDGEADAASSANSGDIKMASDDRLMDMLFGPNDKSAGTSKAKLQEAKGEDTSSSAARASRRKSPRTPEDGVRSLLGGKLELRG